ncbi:MULTISPECIES: SagB/ThcOx family dehydrogenase [unclassified Breznakia]|uniref:SagB/ThcOx family dehydrogenase n=1 Tax=unclassified Breznakia TaxID=2623764 RepID=UPI002475981C|nr:MULTISPECIES: SagB/ThcOx family dehydrogenase [unclassified Breznakia]MDH6365941.1 SagB-type dehydrogenase family enzyme [Breznakia sp. PH1-1]MDH6403127.1 SagB-type dehydrogenase family enzyme [Breznakia sp. PF1-11]MDH6410836.1 SagB-type dehydrogenase family enzyme [Breznakia sp. PFB1-11]MDH6413107.1 SagB-type dehydrogenase family enzyme [Breznakia sp. PFB1-14]MDH6415475.1 SagB-type dehydrogenase family enzyme [Breznakia sp. PFB1-4]
MKKVELINMIKTHRAFMKYQDIDFESDQELKLQQPPLTKPIVSKLIIDLPKISDAKIVNSDITKVFYERRSHRVYTDEVMSLAQLSYALWASQGVKEIRGKSYATIRTVASGGARHPFETYIVVRNCEGLKPGVYMYLPLTHQLTFLKELEDMQQVVSESVCGQVWASKANVMLYWSFVAYRAEWRYGPEAQRVALIDAGHVGQNLYLACSALGLGTCGIAAFDNEKCNTLLDLDGDEEFVVYCAPVGTIGSDEKAEQDFYAFVKEQGL